MPSHPEVARLREVYRSYQERGLADTRWSEDNPGNRAAARWRDRVIRQRLHAVGLLPLKEKSILDVGCGRGRVLAGFLEWGAAPERLTGVDLSEERVAEARQAHPGLRFDTVNAEQLPFPDAAFDLVCFYTVFTSVLDREMAGRMATEASRVLRPGGAVLWYDFRFNNPRNPHVRGMRRAAVQDLFPGFRLELRTVTLAPPLARRLGPLTGVLYPVLACFPFLRTHYAGLLLKPPAP